MNTSISFNKTNTSKEDNMYTHLINDKRRMMVFNIPGFKANEFDESIDTGSWVPALIMRFLPKDVQMVISFYNWEQAANFDPTGNENQVFWADASGITHIKIKSDGHEGWMSPFDALGLKVKNNAKLAKRLKEIARISRYHTAIKPNINFYDHDDQNEMFYDGMNVISRSFAKMMGLRKYHIRGNIRILTPEGLIKGDAIIVPDDQLKGYDMLVPSINMKAELSTTDWYFTTFNPHHAHNQAMFDVQSASWLREWLYPRDLMCNTMTSAINTVLESLRNGEWPNWMIMPEDAAHVEASAATLHDLESADEAFKRHYLRWQMFGRKPEESAAIMGMAGNAFNSKLQSRLLRKDHNNMDSPKLWIPLPYACYGHIITHESLLIAGYDIPAGAEDKLFFHEKSGSFSLPGDQFADTFEAHGTWDLDDSAKFFLRKDGDKTVCVIVRSPNSDGEYSIHEVYGEENFPTYHTYGIMPSINMSKAPARIESIMSKQKIDGMPANTHIMEDSFTYAEAMHSIEIQESNPGIGGIANAFMVYYDSMSKSPEHVLATMGDMVDCVQQTPYMEGFDAIDAFTGRMWDDIKTYGAVDRYLYNTRVPLLKRSSIGTYEGYFWNLYEHFAKECARFDHDFRVIAFETRAANPIPNLMELDLNVTAGGKMVLQAERLFAEVAGKFKGTSVKAKLARSRGNRAVVNYMVDELNKLGEDEANKMVMAMYRWTLIPGSHPRERLGKSDRAVFAPTDPGKQSVMDIFLRALVSIGSATVPDISKTDTMDDLVWDLLDVVYKM